MDGYDKLVELQALVDNQEELNEEISNTIIEMDTLPEMPSNIDLWMEEFQSKFKLSDFEKVFKINRKMNSLIEKRDLNSQKLKVIVIDNLINKINSILKED